MQKKRRMHQWSIQQTQEKEAQKRTDSVKTVNGRDGGRRDEIPQ